MPTQVRYPANFIASNLVTRLCDANRSHLANDYKRTASVLAIDGFGVLDIDFPSHIISVVECFDDLAAMCKLAWVKALLISLGRSGASG
jgi:hypothetical protein